MRIGKHELVTALALRYDHHSATTMFEAARERAGLADKDTYEAAEVATFRAALARVGDRLDRVNARLDALAGGAAPAEPGAPVEKVEPKAEVVDAKKSDKKKKPDEKADKAEKAEKAENAEKPEPAEPAAAPTWTVVALSGIELPEGDEMMMCGDFVAWEVEQARAMVRAGDEWLGSVELLPGTEVAFKFLRKSAAGAVAWEPGENRTLVGGVRLDVTWGVR